MDPKLLEWQKKELVPLGRFSTPEEQSWMTLLLLHDVGGAYMTGQEYFVEYVYPLCHLVLYQKSTLMSFFS
jgi:sorbose reductase